MTIRSRSPEPDRAGGGASAPPSARLIGLHRHSLTHVLIVGGSATLRQQVARAFHRESPLCHGPFVAAEGTRDREPLRQAFRGWTTGEAAVGPYRDAEEGTLYVDEIEGLDADAQNLLLVLARAMQGEPVIAGPRAGRLVIGNPRPLSEAVAQGRFLPTLYDTLDKVRVELGPSTTEPSA